MSTVVEKYMMRCIQLARNGLGYTSPNPMVGSVIVHNDRIIGEGFHRKAGEAHAEVNTIASVKEESLLSQSTIYVNLEPCSHYGRTPPCAELIIRKKIPRVVVGCLDPFPEVSGRGIRMLRDAGVEVITGVLEKECRELNKTFMTSHEKQRPYILLKWAQSSDGFIDGVRTSSNTAPIIFSTPTSTRQVHKLRSEYAAILVGTHTALLDNPSLTVRHWAGRSPVRVVIDRQLKIPANYHLLDGSVETFIFTSVKAIDKPNITYIQTDFSRSVIRQILNELYKRRLNSLMVEGGSFLLNEFIKEGLYDEIRVESAPFILGEGVKAPCLP